jgi:hypothetical protein
MLQTFLQTFDVCNDVMVAVCGRPSGLPGAFDRFANLHAAATLTCLATGAGGAILQRRFTMFKSTPNPPETNDVSPYDPLDPKKLNEAADRALDHYLNPLKASIPPRKPSTIYLIAPDIDTETLLANAGHDTGFSQCHGQRLRRDDGMAASQHDAGYSTGHHAG